MWVHEWWQSSWMRLHGRDFVSKSAGFRPVPIFTILMRPSTRAEATGASCARALPAQILVEPWSTNPRACHRHLHATPHVQKSALKPASTPRVTAARVRSPTTTVKCPSVNLDYNFTSPHCRQAFRHSLIACHSDLPPSRCRCTA